MSTYLGVRQTWVRMPPLSLTSCMNLGNNASRSLRSLINRNRKEFYRILMTVNHKMIGTVPGTQESLQNLPPVFPSHCLQYIICSCFNWIWSNNYRACIVECLGNSSGLMLSTKYLDSLSTGSLSYNSAHCMFKCHLALFTLPRENGSSGNQRKCKYSSYRYFLWIIKFCFFFSDPEVLGLLLAFMKLWLANLFALK